MGKEKFVIGDFVEHIACPECPSSDGLAVYTSGYVKCFAEPCTYYKYPDQNEGVKTNTNRGKKVGKTKKPFPVNGDFLSKRGISRSTMEFMGYRIGEYQGEPAHIVAVPDAEGRGHVTTKIRLSGKQFRIAGDTESAGFVFQDRWPSGGTKLVITEGEFDALSVAEAQSCKYPVVSLLNGAKSVEKTFKAAYTWVNSFDEIILWFDDDEAGRSAAEEAAKWCDIGKVKIVKTPLGYKDANELLKADELKAIVSAVWQAEPYSPSGFESFSSLADEIMKPVEWGKPWIYPELTEWTYGRRGGETYFFGAGTGVGKTDFFTQQAAADIRDGEKVAMFSFEQPTKETATRLAGKYAGQQFHIPDAGWTDDQKREAIKRLSKTDCLIYKHFGAADWDEVETRITALAMMGYQHFYIDHLTAFAAHADDERKMLEGTCADMAGLCQRLDVNFYVISHLATPDGTPHEEGGRVFIKHFKGSRAIGFWAHFMFGIERDTQAEDPAFQLRSRFRCLKDRYTGRATGNCLTQLYDPETGLQSVDPDWTWDDEKKKEKSASDHGFDNNTDF